jgi:homospermidine synthase
MDFSKLIILDMADRRDRIPQTLEAGAKYVQDKIEPHDMNKTLSQHVGPGDLLIDLAWDIDAKEIMTWCYEHDVMYLNTSVEIWNPYDFQVPPQERTLYARHMVLREMVAKWKPDAVTHVVEHGANPGLVSHWTKRALHDIYGAMVTDNVRPDLHRAIQDALDAGNYPEVARLEQVKVIHVSERDTQVANIPKRVNEFVNTWSIQGFREEGIAPAELGWGTHERRLPVGAHVHTFGPCNQICIAEAGIDTYVRSWVPLHGEIMGMIVRHGESFTISDYLTVRDGKGKPLYRPTVHYAYHPCNDAIVSLWELRMRNFKLQPNLRIMNNEITDGMDELGVLLLGHHMNGWWTGSQLDIHEARRHVPGQSATTLQVAASILGAVSWMIRNPRKGYNVPDMLPYNDVLKVATPYLGPSPSVQTDWTPLKNRVDLFGLYAEDYRPPSEDVWQFDSFRVS